MGAVLIDSQLLLLQLVGSVSPSWIADHRRLQAYDEAAFKLLDALLRMFSGIVLLPQVLAETSNLLGYARERRVSQLRANFARFIIDNGELYVPSPAAVRASAFRRLGLADAALLIASEITGTELTLLTDDQPLAIEAEIAGLHVQNFRHWRNAEPSA